MDKPLKLKEIAARINAHLKRFEADREINKPGPPVNGHQQLHPYYHANAGYHGGRYVRVLYISFQGSSTLTRDEAVAYLAWLDAGNVGTHFKQQRLSAPKGG